MDFGTKTTAVAAEALLGADFGDTSGIYINDGSLDPALNNVVREAKDLSDGLTGNDPIGQILDAGVTTENAWPFIQLYPLNPTGNVVVQYNKGGGAQSVTLTFDTVDEFANCKLR